MSVRVPLAIHCPPVLTPKQAHRLGRVARTRGFGVANRGLGVLIPLGQFVALAMFASWGVVLLGGDAMVWRVLLAAYVLVVVAFGLGVVSLVLGQVRHDRVLDLQHTAIALGPLLGVASGVLFITGGTV